LLPKKVYELVQNPASDISDTANTNINFWKRWLFSIFHLREGRGRPKWSAQGPQIAMTSTDFTYH